MTAANSANTVKLGNTPHFASNPGKYFLVCVLTSLHFSRSLN